MRIRHQLAELSLACLRPQVNADALFVAVQAGEVAVADLPGDLTVRRLDLDDLRAEIGEQHRGVRSGEHDADLENADARQRPCIHGWVIVLQPPAAKSPRGFDISTRSVRRGRSRWAAAAPTDRSRPHRRSAG